METIPKLKPKRHDFSQDDPDGLLLALMWQRVADPGDMDMAATASTVYVSTPVGTDVGLGGPGSGNWAHRGRAGKVGGSAPRNAGMTIRKGKDWLERYEQVAGRPHPFAQEITRSKPQPTAGERYYSGDPQTQNIQSLYASLPEAVQALADKTGVIALDATAREYVEEKQGGGELGNITNDPQTYVAAVTDVYTRNRFAEQTRIAIRQMRESARGGMPIDRNAYLYTHAVAYASNMTYIIGKATGDYDTNKILETLMEGSSSRDTAVLKNLLTKSAYDFVDSYNALPPGREKVEVQDLLGRLAHAYYLNKAIAQTGGTEFAKLSDIEPDTDPSALALTNTFAHITARMTPARVPVEHMTAIRTADAPATARVQREIQASWDHTNHNEFTATVNHVFEIISQDGVRQNYTQIEKARDNVMTTAYHGTHCAAAQAISATGFIVPKSIKAGRMLGDGVYLARNSSKSMQYVGTSYGRGEANGVLLIVKAARGKEVRWDFNNTYSNQLDTLYAPGGNVTGLLNDEWVVRDPGAVLPLYWIDVSRSYR